MQIRTYILFLLLYCLACNNNKVVEKTDKVENGSNTENLDSVTNTENGFDKTKWRAKDDHHYPYRDEMLEEVLSHLTLDSLKRDEVIDLLGQPDRSDGNYLFYRIAQKRLAFWPLHTKTLVIKLSEDSTINRVRIHE